MNIKTLNKTFYKIDDRFCSCRYLDWIDIKADALELAYAEEEKHFHLLDLQLQDKYVQQARIRRLL